MINRLIEPTGGDIRIDGDDVRDARPVELRRGIGYVIQQVGLFPHLTVADNVGHRAAPARLGPRRASTARVDELLDLVGLRPGDYRERYPAPALRRSAPARRRGPRAGGGPAVMLMDEPFGAVDPITRARLQDEFLRLQRELRKTSSSSRTTSTRPSSSATGSRSSARAGGSRSTTRPSEILAQPGRRLRRATSSADDRALKALGLRTLSELPIAERSGDGLPRVPRETNLRDALALLIAERSEALVVTGDGGAPLGVVTREDILR